MTISPPIPFSLKGRTAATAALVVLLAVSACSNGDTGLVDFADRLEELVTTMNQGLDLIEADAAASEQTIETQRMRLDSRAALRTTFLREVEALEHPPEVEGFSVASLAIIADLAAAEQALAAKARAVETVEELEDSAEVLAFLAIDEQAIAMCRAVEAQLDTSDDVTEFPDMPWIPTELSDVVSVVFGCGAEDRGAPG